MSISSLIFFVTVMNGLEECEELVLKINELKNLGRAPRDYCFVSNSSEEAEFVSAGDALMFVVEDGLHAMLKIMIASAVAFEN
jgi:hypothetical protein